MQTAVSTPHAKRLPLYGLLGAILISTTGNAVAQLAIPWYVLATTGSPAKMGLTAFFGTVPLALSAFFGGTIVDRLGFKRASMLADVASGLSVAAIPLLHATAGLPFWSLLALVFLGTLFDSSGVTARTALLVDLAKDARIQLERVNSMEEVALNIPLLLGPPIAGALIAWMDASRVLWIDALSFAVSAAVVTVLIPPSSGERKESQSGYLRELAEGLRFVRRDRVLFWLITFTALVTLLVAPLPSVLLPIFIRTTYGSALDLGILIAVFGVGLLIGVVVYGVWGHRLPRRPIVIAGVVGLGTMGLVFSAFPPLGVILLTAFLGGIMYGPFSPLLSTVAGEHAPEDLRGRVFGILSAVATVTAPIGVLAVGVAIQALGVRVVVLIITICLFAVAAAMSVNGSLRELGTTEPTQIQ